MGIASGSDQSAERRWPRQCLVCRRIFDSGPDCYSHTGQFHPAYLERAKKWKRRHGWLSTTTFVVALIAVIPEQYLPFLGTAVWGFPVLFSFIAVSVFAGIVPYIGVGRFRREWSLAHPEDVAWANSPEARNRYQEYRKQLRKQALRSLLIPALVMAGVILVVNDAFTVRTFMGVERTVILAYIVISAGARILFRQPPRP